MVDIYTVVLGVVEQKKDRPQSAEEDTKDRHLPLRAEKKIDRKTKKKEGERKERRTENDYHTTPYDTVERVKG